MQAEPNHYQIAFDRINGIGIGSNSSFDKGLSRSEERHSCRSTETHSRSFPERCAPNLDPLAADKLQADLADGKPLDHQSEPTLGSILGLSYQQGGRAGGPAAASLWLLLQPPLTCVGSNTALRVRGSHFDGLSTEGFIDVSRRVGIDFAAELSPGPQDKLQASGDVDLSARYGTCVSSGGGRDHMDIHNGIFCHLINLHGGQ
jgi:hypothetical protein